MKTTQKTLLALAISHALCHLAHADDNTALSTTIATDETGTASYQAVMANEVITIERPFSQQIGTQKLTASHIANRPTGNGNITELFKSNPNVQFANNSDTSNMGGEISPNEVSIHGEKFYNNNYTIDGISNNDNLHPAAETLAVGGTPQGNGAGDLPSGGTQSFWLDGSLLKNVEIFDSNISAKYGNFTGGVINAQLKDANINAPSGRVYYRTTRDDWAEFHIQDNQQEDFNSANRLNRQPKFTKHQYGISLNQPINDKMALLFSYNKTTSNIPYYHDILGQWQDQTRTNENFLLSGNYHFDNGDKLKASFMYSPHKSLYYKRNVKNGDFTTTGGGYLFNMDWSKNLSFGHMESKLAWKQTTNEVEHKSSIFHNYLSSDRFNWKSSATSAQEGGFGKFATKKQTLTLKQDFKLNPFNTQHISHQINTGWQADFATGEYQRHNDNYQYTWARNNTNNCADDWCYPREQYVRQYLLYDTRHIKADDDTYSAYIEDNLTHKNLDVSLGLRADYNRYLNNLNFSPRFSFTYDVKNDDNTRIFGGANRYYSNSMLTYKLRQGISSFDRYSRTSPTANWSMTSVAGTQYEVDDLKTPYSDELNLGIAQKFYNSLWTLKYVNRNSNDTFVQQRINGVRYLTNAGYSNSDDFSLTIKPLHQLSFKYADIDFTFGANYLKTKTNTTTYDNRAEGDDLTAIIIDGQLKDTGEIPNLDYNSPWRAFIDINTHFPKHNIDFNQRLNHKSGYVGYQTNSGVCPNYNSTICGNHIGRIQEYVKRDVGSHFTLDWNIRYNKPLNNGHSLELSLDVDNVLNRKVIATSNNSANNNIDTYKMGRNFWLGVSYNW